MLRLFTFARQVAPLALALMVSVAGCKPAEPKAVDLEGLTGPKVTPPIAKPDFVLNTTEGKPFNFRQETEGYATLLFFGYTHCPDVCPVHLANIAAALKTVGPSVGEHLKVVFVTTDPARDTPEVVRTWLDKFDKRFIGLVGKREEVNAVLQQMRLPPFAVDSTPGDSNYYVDHVAMVLAFTRDDLAHVVYPFGVRQNDWANDLVILTKGS
jgi:protein SCO1/2